MHKRPVIFGRGNCPHTQKALEAYGENAVFRDILFSTENYDEMMRLSNNAGRIPVIVNAEGKVTVGFNRGS